MRTEKSITSLSSFDDKTGFVDASTSMQGASERKQVRLPARRQVILIVVPVALLAVNLYAPTIA